MKQGKNLLSCAAAAFLALQCGTAVYADDLFTGYSAETEEEIPFLTEEYSSDEDDGDVTLSAEEGSLPVYSGTLGTEEISLTPGEIQEIAAANEEFFAGTGLYDDTEDLGLSPVMRDSVFGYSYTTDYFYDQLDTEGKKVWLRLRNACETFAASSKDISVNYISAYIGTDFSTDKTTLRNLYNAFYYSNPQYYFLMNGISYLGNDAPLYGYKKGTLIFAIGDDFKKASARSRYTSGIKTLTDSWMPEINAASDYMEKERIIYENLSDLITYVSTGRDQSIAGALVDRLCVCNGYALAAEYFLNAAGFDCITVVGNDHAWNIVDLYGKWYELDVTWLDTGGNDKRWVNKSHSTFLRNDQNGSHVYRSELYDGLFGLPSAVSDTVTKSSGYYTAKQSPVVLTVNGVVDNCDDVDEAFSKISDYNNSMNSYEIIVNSDNIVSSFALPAAAESVTVTGGDKNHLLVMDKSLTISPACRLTLDNVGISVGSTNKIAVNSSSALVLNDVSFDAQSVSLKGTGSSTLVLSGSCGGIDSISGYGSVDLRGAFTPGKTFDVNGLRLSSQQSVFTVPVNSAVKITDLSGVSGSAMDFRYASEKGFKPAAVANADISGGIISIINAKNGDCLFNSKTLPLNAFDLSRSAEAAGSNAEYTLSRNGSKVTVGAAVFELRDGISLSDNSNIVGKYSSFNDVKAEIEARNDSSASYVVYLSDYFDSKASLKFPKAGTYNSIMLTSAPGDERYELGFKGNIKLTGDIYLMNIKLSAFKSGTSQSVKYKINGSKNTVYLYGIADLGLCSITSKKLVVVGNANIVYGNIKTEQISGFYNYLFDELTLRKGADLKVTKQGMDENTYLIITYDEPVVSGYQVASKFVGSGYEKIYVNGNHVILDKGKLKAA